MSSFAINSIQIRFLKSFSQIFALEATRRHWLQYFSFGRCEKSSVFCQFFGINKFGEKISLQSLKKLNWKGKNDKA